MNTRIPTTILTGFLGSGKTTILSNLLKKTKTRRLAILINEFGEVSIDGALMRQSSDAAAVEIHDLTQGLVAYSGDAMFLPTMHGIAARRSRIDHVLIETSGLAAPTAVMQALQSAELQDAFVLDATIAVVDTPLFLSQAFDPTDGESQVGAAADRPIAEVFDLQLGYADVVILNKIDALTDDELLHAEESLRTRSPSIRFVEVARRADVDARLILGLRLHQAVSDPSWHTPPPALGTGVLADHGGLDGHAHSGLAAHEHGLMTHKHFHEQDPGWLAFVLRSWDPQHPQALHAALLRVAESQPLLRVKGFLRHATDGHAYLVQGVRSRVLIQPWHAANVPMPTDLAMDFEDDHHPELHQAPHDPMEHATRAGGGGVSQSSGSPTRAPAAHDQQLRHHEPRHESGETEGPTVELVCIGYHLKREAVRHVLTDVTRAVWH